MSATRRTIRLAALLGLLLASPVLAGRVDGTIKLGAISLDEDAGDLSAVQETYNIHDGFSVSQVLLDGQLGTRSFFRLDLEEINLDSRKGLFSIRVPDLGRLTVRHDQHRQLFDDRGAVASERKDWRFGASLTPTRWLRLVGGYDIQTREGDRLSYPAGTTSVLGDVYDYTLRTHRWEAEVHEGGRGVAVGLETSDLSDDRLSAADRSGRVFSLRAYGSDPVLPVAVSHSVRAAFGKHELTASDLDYTLRTFRYVGTVKPLRQLHVRYDLGLSRIENDATGLQTDRVQNDLDVTLRLRHGSVSGGYGYVTNDDDRTLTSYDVWRAATTFHYDRWIKGKVSYATSEKNVDEDLTLLRDVEDSRFRASLESRPLDELTVGARFADRTREFPVIGVEAEGTTVGGFARLALTGWGGLMADYSYSDDDYDDRLAGFATTSHVVTGRVDIEAVRDLRLSAGVTYLDVGGDLDIEKSILMFEGSYDLLDDYFVEIKYNVYNYDDYILLDRYYTANVVWVNFGYRLSLE
jgi:hypothetical protein